MKFLLLLLLFRGGGNADVTPSESCPEDSGLNLLTKDASVTETACTSGMSDLVVLSCVLFLKNGLSRPLPLNAEVPKTAHSQILPIQLKANFETPLSASKKKVKGSNRSRRIR